MRSYYIKMYISIQFSLLLVCQRLSLCVPLLWVYFYSRLLTPVSKTHNFTLRQQKSLKIPEICLIAKSYTVHRALPSCVLSSSGRVQADLIDTWYRWVFEWSRTIDHRLAKGLSSSTAPRNPWTECLEVALWKTWTPLSTPWCLVRNGTWGRSTSKRFIHAKYAN